MRNNDFQGACLYVPALHASLEGVLDGSRIPGLRLVVICLEDSIAEWDTFEALSRLRKLFQYKRRCICPRIYVRPRSLSMLEDILQWDERLNWDGFVLPKLNLANIQNWLRVSSLSDQAIMPILETADIFDPYRVADLCAILESDLWSSKIEAIRIGGTDLFAVLGIRRPRHIHVYDSIIGSTLRSVACNLMSRGWSVTAPVCESLVCNATMDSEVLMDVEAGFVGKTAINPLQVAKINAAFRVSQSELHEANRILRGDAVIFRSRDAMCEVAPHTRWAKRIVDRANIFGLRTTEHSMSIPTVSITE